VRAVGVVAVEAVLLHRRVPPDEGAALFGVAGSAELVHRLALHHRMGERPVGVMAIGALHTALDDGVVGGLGELRANLLMAVRAGFVLQLAHGRFVWRDRGIGLVEREARTRRRRAVQAVAVVAGDVVLAVLAGIPERQVTVGTVALQARLGLRRDRDLGIVEPEDPADSP